jgi:RNA 2',3'-cyclic 3'-phosphodiesterase
MPSMRLFVAVDIDDRMRARVARLIDALRTGMEAAHSAARVSWVAPDRLHLTLQFIGHVSEDVTAAIQTRLGPPFDLSVFDMRFDGIGTFPPGGRPRVVWLGVTRGMDGLAALHDEVQRRLADVPFRRESRPFSPHLTVGRFKTGGTRADADCITRLALKPSGGCTIDHVTLYQSRLSPRGPTYTPLRVTPLAAKDTGR